MLRAALEAAPCRRLRGAPWELREPPSRPGALWSPLRQTGGLPFQPRAPGSSWGWLLPGLPSAACPGRSPGPGPVRPHTGRGSEGFLALPGGAQQASETAPCPRDLSVCSRRLRAPAVWLPASSTSRCPVGGGPLPTSQDDEAAVERVGDPCSGSDDQAQPIPGPRAPLGSR